MDEQSYIQGSRMAWRLMLEECIRNLGYETTDPQIRIARFISEREEAISHLRSLCEEFGDNSWEATLHLADIIDKHLGKHLMP
ncbi:MAG: hypothetical protein V3W19_14970 [Desulfatiglandales bacterium]